MAEPAVTSPEAPPACYHCGTQCRGEVFHREAKAFCCRGCLTVYELLTENGLGEFYRLSETAGVRVSGAARAEQFKFLDEPAVRERLVDYADARLTRVTFQIPAIHCIACVWLLENLYRLQPGIGQSQVNFPRKEVALAFNPAAVKLSAVVALLASLGYEPELKLAALEARPRHQQARRLWMQIGFAGFAFGNIMLMSLSLYFGMDEYIGLVFRRLTGWISLVLALPVMTYSALDYWRAAWTSLRRRRLNIDVPIALGIAVLFVRSCQDVFAGGGNGYFDSLCGLILFLLCGRLFQQKTYDRLAFDRDYKSFFPLSVTRKIPAAASVDGAEAVLEEQVSLAQLAVGDRLVIRNGELIPADARLVAGPALIDYSFVTGESELVAKAAGEHLYAGGRQAGGAIEVETVKEVSQSYLTSLWNQEAFRKERLTVLDTLTNRYSQHFTKLVMAIALAAALWWLLAESNPAVAVKAFASVLIVACPCALALAAPFGLGTAQRVLARRHIFLKNPHVLETLARVDAVVFDKTGTLTAAGAAAVTWHGAPLGEAEERWIFSLAQHSAHPLPAQISGALARGRSPEPVRSFVETPGGGMEGGVAGHEVRMGSAAWLASRGVAVADGPHQGSVVHVVIDGRDRGYFELAGAVRPGTQALVADLARGGEVALLSGDNEKERARFAEIFGPGARLQFNQSPLNKLGFIRDLQAAGRTVMMVGDGLNDAGALRQSDAGVAVVERVSAFSPASDVILAAGNVARLAAVLRFARRSVGVVRAAVALSAVYNLVGVYIAARGWMAPVVCAVLMPVSSVTVVAFACGATAWLGRGLATDKMAVQPR
jgi:P-type Cu+ transporter